MNFSSFCWMIQLEKQGELMDWAKYQEVANRFERKARREDREDLNHTIILSLAQAQIKLDSNGGGQLSDVAMLRIASYECHKYWRQQKRLLTILSLNTEIKDGDGNTTELIDTLADDKAIDLEAWLEAKIWLLGCPKRLVVIAGKRLKGIPLTNKELQYLWYWRHKEQKRLC
jgi:hypothetical protein